MTIRVWVQNDGVGRAKVSIITPGENAEVQYVEPQASVTVIVEEGASVSVEQAALEYDTSN